ncbi:MAG: hypothetical protein E6X36_04140 [Clostridioides difficile]|nr:hypothetical protein [Clostridioides difficile]
MKDEKRKEREQREIEKKNRIKRQNIEKEIEKLEIEIEKLDILLCQEEVYSNPDKAKEVSQEKINSHILAITVARAAPFTPNAGRPKLPNINP